MIHPTYQAIYHLDDPVEDVVISVPDTSPTNLNVDFLDKLLAPINSIIGAMSTGERVQVSLALIGLLILMNRGK